MKKNFNVIQIKGVRGLLLAGFVLSCLCAGFIVFPGWVGMNLWNYLATSFNALPMIGLIQGILLWGILAVSYFIFRKEKVVVCMKTPQGLTDEELKAVFADMKKQSLEEPILQAMLKAREAELKYKAQQNPKSVEEKEQQQANTDTSNV